MYVKFAQILILNIVCKNSINGLQCYSLRIFISPCYGWDTSNGSWGLFLVFFGHAPLKPHHVEPYEAAELWHQNIATQSVIKLYSTILCDSVGQWYFLVSVSEFYLVSVPDILHWRLRDFYTILNCVGTQNQSCGYAGCAQANRTMVAAKLKE